MAISNCSAPSFCSTLPQPTQEERQPQLGGDGEQIVSMSRNSLLKGFQKQERYGFYGHRSHQSVECVVRPCRPSFPRATCFSMSLVPATYC